MPEPQYPERTYQIIGTIPDTKYSRSARRDAADSLCPAAQFPVTAQGPGTAMMIAAEIGPAAITAVRRAIGAKYPNMILQFFDFQQGFATTLWASA